MILTICILAGVAFGCYSLFPVQTKAVTDAVKALYTVVSGWVASKFGKR